MLAPIWPEVNRHLGTCATLPELVEQLGIARFGHRPKVADTFCGGGLDPFRGRADGLRCLCLGPQSHRLHAHLGRVQHHRRIKREARRDRGERKSEVAAAVDAEITRLGIEHDAAGQPGESVSLLLGDALPQDRLDGADGTFLGDLQEAQCCGEADTRPRGQAL